LDREGKIDVRSRIDRVLTRTWVKYVLEELAEELRNVHANFENVYWVFEGLQRKYERGRMTNVRLIGLIIFGIILHVKFIIIVISPFLFQFFYSKKREREREMSMLFEI